MILEVRAKWAIGVRARAYGFGDAQDDMLSGACHSARARKVWLSPSKALH